MTKRFATLRVLVVSNNADQQRRLLTHLESLGVTYCVAANSVLEALSLLCDSQHNFQIVISDKEMKELDGMDLVLQIRCNELLDHVQVAVISDKLSNELVQTTEEANLRTLMKRLNTWPIPQEKLDACVIGRALHEFAGA